MSMGTCAVSVTGVCRLSGGAHVVALSIRHWLSASAVCRRLLAVRAWTRACTLRCLAPWGYLQTLVAACGLLRLLTVACGYM